MFFVFLLYGLFASIFTIGKTSLQFAQPVFIIGSRMAVAGLLLLLFQFFRDARQLRVSAKSALQLALLAFFNIFLCNICEFWGLQHLSSAKTCLIYSISPFASALFSYWLLSEMMTSRKWLGLIVGFIGTLPILFTHTTNEQSLQTFAFISWPELSVIGAALSAVYGWIIIRKLVSQHQLSPIVVNGYSMLFGGLLALGLSRLIEPWNPLPVTAWNGYLETSLALIVISNFICYNLYGALLKKYTATFMSFAGFLTPIFAALFGWLFLNEIIPWQYWTSLAIILLGLYLFHREELRRGILVK